MIWNQKGKICTIKDFCHICFLEGKKFQAWKDGAQKIIIKVTNGQISFPIILLCWIHV